MTSDQRQFKRIDLPVTIRHRPVGELTEMWSVGTLMDLSAGGLRFSSLKALQEGMRLEFQLVLSARREPYVLLGSVVWEKQSPGGMLEYGVVFADTSPERQAELDELVEFLTKGPRRSGG